MRIKYPETGCAPEASTHVPPGGRSNYANGKERRVKKAQVLHDKAALCAFATLASYYFLRVLAYKDQKMDALCCHPK
jgi:hypothetical protein